MAFASVFELGALDGTNGFRISGESLYDNSSWSVASAGDVNGDGVDDLIIGAPYVRSHGSDSGASYVVFGRNTAVEGNFAANLELGALDGVSGFRISGSALNDRSGFSVASAGDVNGDGIGDLIVGAPYADPTAPNAGSSYVVFGRDTASAGAFAANLELSALDGSNGFRIDGAMAIGQVGRSVASAGDVNGDGLGDLIVGGPYAYEAGLRVGVSYVVFGRDTATEGAFAASLAVGALDGTNGFRIGGAAWDDRTGCSVASAGDVNGDGIADLVVGARFAGDDDRGAAYVVFGRNAAVAGAFGAGLDVTALDGTNGFRLDGAAAFERSGWSVAAAGDINGDGIGDLMVGAPSAGANGPYTGACYVVFGRDTAEAGAFAASLDLNALDGANGFRIVGAAAGHGSGSPVASAGDVNGDGIDDLIIGAAGVHAGGPHSGASYVVFGKDTANAGLFAASLDLGALNGGRTDSDSTAWPPTTGPVCRWPRRGT